MSRGRTKRSVLALTRMATINEALPKTAARTAGASCEVHRFAKQNGR